MLVQRVLMPVSSLESWTVLGDDDAPVEPVERYLAYLTDIERSPNTIKAYAHDLKDWLVFLDQRGLDWRETRWKTSASSSHGCGCHHRAGTAGSRCCPTDRSPLRDDHGRTGNFRRSAAFVSSMPGTASAWATWSPNSSPSGSNARDGNRSSTTYGGGEPERRRTMS